MTAVIVQPAYGNRVGQANAAKTLHTSVPFQEPGYIEALTDTDRQHLSAMHPTAEARFWGATRVHDERMRGVTTGDVVLFAGQNRVQAIGEVGYTFQNPSFADRLWDPHPDNGSWHNLYSLLSFAPTDIPYEDVHEIRTTAEGMDFRLHHRNLFRSLTVLNALESAAVIDGLSITTRTEERAAAEREAATARRLRSRVAEVEKVHTPETAYDRTAERILVHRTEAVLVADFRSTISHETGRAFTPVGVTDLHVRTAEGYEIIEAKSDSSPRKVREAVAQLLHYVPYGPQPVRRLTALFPDRPDDLSIEYLHRLGIDCLYLGTPSYVRLEAPLHRRRAISSAWVSEPV